VASGKRKPARITRADWGDLFDALEKILKRPDAQRIIARATEAILENRTNRADAERALAKIGTMIVSDEQWADVVLNSPHASRNPTERRRARAILKSAKAKSARAEPRPDSDELRKRRWTPDECKAALRQTKFPGRHEYRRQRNKIGRDKLPDDYTILTHLVGGGKRPRKGDPPRLWSDALDAARP
jgi:hypothetical protein